MLVFRHVYGDAMFPIRGTRSSWKKDHVEKNSHGAKLLLEYTKSNFLEQSHFSNLAKRTNICIHKYTLKVNYLFKMLIFFLDDVMKISNQPIKNWWQRTSRVQIYIYIFTVYIYILYVSPSDHQHHQPFRNVGHQWAQHLRIPWRTPRFWSLGKHVIQPTTVLYRSARWALDPVINEDLYKQGYHSSSTSIRSFIGHSSKWHPKWHCWQNSLPAVSQMKSPSRE